MFVDASGCPFVDEFVVEGLSDFVSDGIYAGVSMATFVVRNPK